MTRVQRLDCELQIDLAPLTTDIFVDALTPELLTDYGQRATTKLTRVDQHTLKVNIESPDITAMRATINSMLRWFEMIKQLLDKEDI